MKKLPVWEVKTDTEKEGDIEENEDWKVADKRKDERMWRKKKT